MGARADRHTQQREQLLNEGLAEVSGELRLIDAADLIVFARMDLHPNIGDLVNSSLELYFAENTVRYGWVATAEASWSEPPALMFDMEFCHAGVTAFFTLVLKGESTAVDLHHISFDNPAGDAVENTARFAAAIEAARAPMALERAARILAAGAAEPNAAIQKRAQG
jgi:hypothetical protein